MLWNFYFCCINIFYHLRYECWRDKVLLKSDTNTLPLVTKKMAPWEAILTFSYIIAFQRSNFSLLFKYKKEPITNFGSLIPWFACVPYIHECSSTLQALVKNLLENLNFFGFVVVDCFFISFGNFLQFICLVANIQRA